MITQTLSLAVSNIIEILSIWFAYENAMWLTKYSSSDQYIIFIKGLAIYQALNMINGFHIKITNIVFH